MKDMHMHVVELLPWYVNGTLSSTDRRTVERHCSECLPCRRALRDEQSVAAVVRRTSMPSAEAAGLERLFETIDRGEPARPGTSGRRRAPWAGSAKRTAVAAAAGLVLFAVAAAWLDIRKPPADSTAGSFSTLSSPAAGTAPRIDVIFAPTESPAAIAAFVTGLDAAVTAGPSDIGRYTLALPESTDVESLLDRLRADPRVRFAGPAFIEDDGP